MWNLISLDGCFEGKKSWDLDFHKSVWGKELEDYSLKQLQTANMLIFGRNTYEGMASYWSSADGETAKYMNKLPKIVCSTKLKTADWNNTTIVKNAVAELPILKNKGDGNMFVFGSGNLSESLMKANLFDEYRLCIAPLFLGSGKHLFGESVKYRKLKLLKERPLQNGGVILMYSSISK